MGVFKIKKNDHLFIFDFEDILSHFLRLSESVKIIKILLANFEIEPWELKKWLHLTHIKNYNP